MTLLPTRPGFCLFEDSRSSPNTSFLGAAGLLLENPSRTLIARTLEDVCGVIGSVDDAANDGLYAAGYVAYEAAAAFAPELKTKPARTDLPFAKFQIFKTARRLETAQLESFWNQQSLEGPSASAALTGVQMPRSAYLDNVQSIQDYLSAGDIYQANLTFALALEAAGHAPALYARLRRNQPSAFSCFLGLGDQQILSASPEQFFQRQGKHISAEPMKGTLAARSGNHPAMLSSDEKNRAENLMITDLLRNDLSRIAVAGSVRVDDLFQVQRLPSVYQMTSKISAELKPRTSLLDIFQALFPCGSVTGAPKVRAMEIIEELESGPRGVYCGAVGLVLPGGNASFAVPIRTLVADAHQTSLHVGSGIVADSAPAEEYAECMVKAAYLRLDQPDFGLIETMALTVQKTGPKLPDLWPHHMARLARSAADLGFCPPNLKTLQADLTAFAKNLDVGIYKLRLVYGRGGEHSLSAAAITPRPGSQPLKVRLGTLSKLDAKDAVFLQHKTTVRWFYAQALAAAQAQGSCHEVILASKDGALREGSYTNIFMKRGDALITPTLNGHFLGGVLRERLLESGEAQAAAMHVDDLKTADALYVGNAVRGLLPAQLIK
ncbi:MAG: aminodeoxychorismate synthase component I [Pseudomonadota bacterium]